MTSVTDLKTTNSRLQRQMLLTVSHDLKTPLSTVVGCLEICNSMGMLAQDKRDTLMRLALAEAHRLDNFITNLLDIVKLESGLIAIRREYCNLRNHVQEAIKRVTAGQKHQVQLEPVGEEMGYLDPLLFSRIVSLVLENAIRHSAANSHICVQYGKTSDEVVFCVRDNGPGMAYITDQQSFDQYSRFSKSDMQNAGTGLGLTICWLMVNLQQGEMIAENHPDGGTMVMIRIPAQQQESETA